MSYSPVPLINGLIADTQEYLISLDIKIAKKEFLKAAEYFNKMKEVNTQIRYNLFFIESEILEGLGYTDKALKVLQDALSERSDISELWYCIGVLQYKMGDFILAKSSFENAIERVVDQRKFGFVSRWINAFSN